MTPCSSKSWHTQTTYWPFYLLKRSMYITNLDQETMTGSSFPNSVKCIAVISLAGFCINIRTDHCVLSLHVQLAVCQLAIKRILCCVYCCVMSICLSDHCWYSIETVIRIVDLFPPSSRALIIFFLSQAPFQNWKDNTVNVGVKFSGVGPF